MKRLYLAVLLLLCSDWSHGQTRQSEEELPDLQTVISRLEKAEQSLQNVEIQNFQLKQEFRKNDSSNWETVKYAESGSAWYTGLRNSKARVNIAQQVTEWTNGKAPWIEIEQDVGYDGQFGRIVDHRSGPLGLPRQVRTGTLLPDIPSQLKDPYQAFADGTAYSIYFYKSLRYSDKTLSEELRAFIARGGHFEVDWDTVFGIRTIRLLKGDLNATHVAFWLDPERGYALRRAEEVSFPYGVPVLRRMEIPELIRAGDGIWFPIRATREEPRRSMQMRLSFRAERVIANNPKFDEGVFTVPFPPNYMIADRVHGGSFRTVTPESIAKAVDSSVESLKRQANTAVPDKGTARMGGGAPPLSSTTFSERRLVMYATVAVASIAVLLLAWLVRRRYRARTVALVFVTSLALNGTTSSMAHDSPTASEGVNLNCGLNVACFGLKWFGQNYDVRHVGDELGVGSTFQEDCSLADIKRFWERRGMSVRGLRADRIDEIIDMLSPNTLAIVRLTSVSGGVDRGHFVILVPTNSGIAVVDIPAEPVYMNRNDAITDAALRQTTGEFLLAGSSAPAGASGGPLFYTSTDVINLGRIPLGKDDFTANIEYENHGSSTLRIDKTHQSCSCMEPPRGDFEVHPSGRGKLAVTFVRKKVASGLNRRRLLLETNDPAHKTVMITFVFDVAETPLPTEASVAPRRIDYGRVQPSLIIERDLNFEVMVPINLSDYNLPTVRAISSSPDLQIDAIEAASDAARIGHAEASVPMQSSASTAPFVKMQVLRFRGHWTKMPPVGPLQMEVKFIVPMEHEPIELKVPIQGQCVK